MDAGTSLVEVDMKLELSVAKPIHPYWMVELHKHMATSEGKKNIISGWRVVSIQDAVKLGLTKIAKS